VTRNGISVRDFIGLHTEEKKHYLFSLVSLWIAYINNKKKRFVFNMHSFKFPPPSKIDLLFTQSHTHTYTQDFEDTSYVNTSSGIEKTKTPRASQIKLNIDSTDTYNIIPLSY